MGDKPRTNNRVRKRRNVWGNVAGGRGSWQGAAGDGRGKGGEGVLWGCDRSVPTFRCPWAAVRPFPLLSMPRAFPPVTDLPMPFVRNANRPAPPAAQAKSRGISPPARLFRVVLAIRRRPPPPTWRSLRTGHPRPLPCRPPRPQGGARPPQSIRPASR